MIKWLKEYWWSILIIVLGALMLSGAIYGKTENELKQNRQLQEIEQLKVEAIIRGYAEYDKETLEWQWKE